MSSTKKRKKRKKRYSNRTRNFFNFLKRQPDIGQFGDALLGVSDSGFLSNIHWWYWYGSGYLEVATYQAISRALLDKWKISIIYQNCTFLYASMIKFPSKLPPCIFINQQSNQLFKNAFDSTNNNHHSWHTHNFIFPFGTDCTIWL